MADKQRSTELRGLGEEEVREPFTVDLGKEAVEEGERQGILESVRHTAEGEPVYGFTQAGAAALMRLRAHKMREDADE